MSGFQKKACWRILGVCAAVIGWLLFDAGQAQILVIDNSTSPLAVALSIDATTSVANVFATDSQTYQLNSITLLQLSGDIHHPLDVELWSDSSSRPASVFATGFSPNGTNALFGTRTYTPAGTVTLSPNTRYWLVLEQAGSSYGWRDTHPVSPLNAYNTGPGTLGGVSLNSGSGWSVETPTACYFQVLATPVPEPAACVTASGIVLAAFGAWRRRQARR